jgi:hypothetical protein
MLFIVGIAIVLVALVSIPRMRAPAGPLGWMSEHWLAEQRASR